MTETLRLQPLSDAGTSHRRPARSALAMGLAAGMPIGMAAQGQSPAAKMRSSQELWSASAH